MSKKSKKRAEEKLSFKREIAENAKKRAKEKPRKINKARLIVISAVSAVLLAALTVGIVIGVMSQKDFDFMTSDLSDYITVKREDYKGYEIEIKREEVTETDVDRKIMALLYQNRAENPSNKGAQTYKVPISVGDTVKIYYRGYTVDENGAQTELSGCSNLLGNIYELGIGAFPTGFMTGFEEGLIGAVPWNYQFNPEDEIITEGRVNAGDILYISYTAIMPDGTTEEKSYDRVNLGDGRIDEKYGVGFKEYFIGDGESGAVEIGKKSTVEKTFTYGDGTAVYVDLKVNCVIRADAEPLTVDVSFPENFSVEALRGVDAKFDVYIKHSIVYETPTYDEKFITETLKLSADDLKDFSGATLVDKHRASLLKEAKEEYENAVNDIIEEKLWTHLRETVKLKKLPESEVNEMYVQIYNELYYNYQYYYSSSYQSFDLFACAYYGIAQGSDWRVYIMREAQDVIIEQIVFYYIMRAEDLVPSDEEYAELYDAKVKEMLDYYVDDIYAEELEKLETEEEKTARIAEIKEEMLDYYGEEYFEELVYYEYANDRIVALAKVKEI